MFMQISFGKYVKNQTTNIQPNRTTNMFGICLVSAWIIALNNCTISYLFQVDVFSFGILLCEILARIPADPEILPRTQVELNNNHYHHHSRLELLYIDLLENPTGCQEPGPNLARKPPLVLFSLLSIWPLLSWGLCWVPDSLVHWELHFMATNLLYSYQSPTVFDSAYFHVSCKNMKLWSHAKGFYLI